MIVVTADIRKDMNSKIINPLVMEQSISYEYVFPCEILNIIFSYDDVLIPYISKNFHEVWVTRILKDIVNCGTNVKDLALIMIKYKSIKDTFHNGRELRKFDPSTKLWTLISSMEFRIIVGRKLRQLCDYAISHHVDVTSLLNRLDRISLNVHRELCTYLMNRDISEQINNKRNLVPFSNGKVLDLVSREVRDLTKDDYFSMTCNFEYDYDTKSETLDNFLNQIMCGDQDKLSLLRRVLYKSFFGNKQTNSFFSGDGYSGKSTLIHLIEKTLGMWCAIFGSMSKRDMEIIADSRPYIRVLIMSEIPKIHLSGNEKIFNNIFVLSKKITNTCIATSDGNAVRRRVDIVEFDARFTHDPQEEFEYPIDDNIDKKLNTEEVRSAFLNWILSTHGSNNME